MKSFLSGKRIIYYKPFSLLVFFVTAFFVASHFFKSVHIEVESAGSKVLESGKYAAQAVKHLYNNSAYIIILFLPIFAYGTKFLFKKSKYNYYEVFTLEAFKQSQIWMLKVLTLPFLFFIEKSYYEISMFLLGFFINVRFNYFVFTSIVKAERILFTFLASLLQIFLLGISITILVTIYTLIRIFFNHI